MSSTSLYTLVAGASLLLAMWQPADADMRFAEEPKGRSGTVSDADRMSRQLDDRVARHKERWEQRKAQRTAASGAGS